LQGKEQMDATRAGTSGRERQAAAAQTHQNNAVCPRGLDAPYKLRNRRSELFHAPRYQIHPIIPAEVFAAAGRPGAVEGRLKEAAEG